MIVLMNVIFEEEIYTSFCSINVLFTHYFHFATDTMDGNGRSSTGDTPPLIIQTMSLIHHGLCKHHPFQS